ncbi:hypothetical protein K1T71_010383 [Dendrolimus kikuchii]|uniref:Uncharacterized protein n=1 Tax=Dendrolimus kikuchii TaxID=765133 RepID=A0ACC1CSN2_9NEOP|nr:hypothetical protein K1T71_010383 [Dendrolimus kikuchii]
MDSEVTSLSEEPAIDLDLYTDLRVQWFKEFAKFVTAPLQPNELSMDKRTFYVSKIIVDKLIHEDKEFTEWSKYIVLQISNLAAN